MKIPKEYFKFKYAKANKGEQFEGLDLITKLLTPANVVPNAAAKTGPLIEELDFDAGKLLEENFKMLKVFKLRFIIEANGQEGSEQCEDEVAEDEEDGDIWYVDQKVGTNAENDSEIKLNNLDIKYGFAQTKSNVFSKLSVNETFLNIYISGLNY